MPWRDDLSEQERDVLKEEQARYLGLRTDKPANEVARERPREAR